MKRLITIITLLLSVAAFAQTTNFSLTPISLTTDFRRPGCGGTLWNEQDAPFGTMHIPTSGAPVAPMDAYHRFAMTEFFGNASASDSTIIFTRFDNFMNMAIDNRQGVRFRVMGLCNNCGRPQSGDNFNGQVQYGAGRPSDEWNVIPWFLHNLQQAEPNAANRDWFSTRGDQKQWIANTNSPQFQRWVRKLSQAIANHINSTSHGGVSYADALRIYDIGYYGCYSEQHSNCICDQINDGTIPVGARHTDAGLMEIIDAQTDYFGGNPSRNWKIVIPFNAFDAMWLSHTFNTVAYGNFLLNHPDSIGWIDDHIGADESYDHDYLELNNRINNAKLMNRWRHSPIGGEPVEWGSPSGRAGVPDYVQRYHMSWFGNGNLNGVFTNSNTTEANNFRLASRIAGYRLRPTGGSANVGASLAITLNWLNEGNAPCYENWTVQYLIKNGAGTTVSTLTSNFTIRYFPPSSAATPHTQAFGIPAVPAGTYGLYVKVIDPTGYRDEMPLAITPQQGDGSYFLGNISLSGGGGNTPPIANAGPNQSITGTSASLNGSSSTDPDGTITTYAWTQVGNTPNTATIVSASSANTSVTGLVPGVYTFNLQVTDNGGAINSDQVQITVGGNQAPVANAGPNQQITSPTSSVTVDGSGSTDDVAVTAYAWTQVGGPIIATIASPSSASSNITGLTTAGVYTFRLTVTDGSGLTSFDDMSVTVNSGNNPPIANAGANQTLTLPVVNFSTILIDGSLSSDPGGAISTYLWTQVGGPTVTITAPTNVSTYINDVTVATNYIFRLTVTDDAGLTNSDDIQITVLPAANGNPVANAGPNQTIQLPTSSVTLNSSGSTDDVAITSRLWTKASGPASFTIVSPTSTSTNVTGLVAGVYVFRITVNDGDGNSDFDEVTITVQAETNAAPIAVAGNNQSITLPTSSASVDGSGSSDDVGVTVYLWTKISGPAGGTISTPNSATTNITSLQAGVYTFRLRVEDAAGLFDTDDLTIQVNSAGNASPVAIISGGAQTIQLPTNSVSLDGSGSTDDVAVTAYLWTQVSGPATATIATPTASTTNMDNLVAGIYTFQLQVSDVEGLTDIDEVQVTVLAADPPDPPIIGGRPAFRTRIKFLPRIP